MAPKSLFSLTISLSQFTPPHIPSNPNPNPNFPLNSRAPKPSIIICKSTNSQIQSHQPPPPNLPVSAQESDGLGAAAPTRGDVYLSRQKSMEAAAIVLSESKNQRNKMKAKAKVLSVSCYGCGAPLQTAEAGSPGYVDSETYELKKRHRQLRTVLCGRCKLLSHGHMITAVGGNGGYSGGKQFVSAEELRERLSHLRHKKALIVKLVDIVDFNGSFLARIRDLAGANPIILVVTKIDLLPKGTDLNCVGDWVVEVTTKKKLNVLSVHLTSSKSLVGITGVASEIQKEKKGRDVYILGSANVGKSAFINALLKTMAQKDHVAAAARKYKPIQSAVPGTTLGPIQIDAFFGGGKLFDTPGVHLHHRQAAVIDSEDLPALAPQSRLKGKSFPVASVESVPNKKEANKLDGFSLFWGGLVRVDVFKVLPSTCLTFYGPNKINIHMIPIAEADEFYQKEVGVTLMPPSGKDRVKDWPGLQTVRQVQIKYDNQKSPACDIAISGLGWISVDQMIEQTGDFDSASLEKMSGELHLAVHVPKQVEIFVRSPMPVGKAGAEWYEYKDLTEKEEELRPKWYF
ncbi:hypothetical protein Sjap_004277 [Stephania japonica]|uniref:CP-type G domain-containing protein n=1 Tax=Stephania japonica TaxID=461633 RepID=A0AAP0K2V8_9MAGN